MLGTTVPMVCTQMARGEAALRTPMPASQAFWISSTNSSNCISWMRNVTLATVAAQRETMTQTPSV